MMGTFVTMLDAVGFLVVAGLLFLPVFWLVGYFIAVWARYGYRDIVERGTPVEIEPIPVARPRKVVEEPPTGKAA